MAMLRRRATWAVGAVVVGVLLAGATLSGALSGSLTADDADLPAASTASALPISCDVATITWDGGAGTNAWSTAANWTPERVPAPTDHVCIPSGAPGAAVRISQFVNVQSIDARKRLEITAGTVKFASGAHQSQLTEGLAISGQSAIEGASPLTISGETAWTQGILRSTGGTTFPAGSTVDLTGPLPKGFGGPIRSEGAMTIGGTGQVTVADIFTNAGVVDLVADAPFAVASSPVDNIVNEAGATWRKSAGTLSSIFVGFENDGVLESLVGTIELKDGSGNQRTGSGTMRAAEGARLLLTRGVFAGAEGATIEGPGTIELATTSNPQIGGPVTVADGARIAWNGGGFIGNGIVVAEGAKITAGGTVQKLFSAKLRNEGTIEVGGTGGISWGTSGILTNRGLIDLVSDVKFQTVAVSETRWLLHNDVAGLLRKTAGVRSEFAVPIDNDGVVSAEVGAIALKYPSGQHGEVHGGRFRAAPVAGATVAFAGGEQRFGEGSSIDGFGTITFEAGHLKGILTVEPGATLAWNGGTMATAAGSVIRPGATLVHGGTTAKTWSGVLRNEGTILLAGNGTLGISVLDVTNVGLIDISGSLTTACSGCTTTPFYLRNERGGVLRKSGGADTTWLPRLTNAGDVVVEPGTSLFVVWPDDITQGSNTTWGGTGSWTVRGTLKINRPIYDIRADVRLEGPAATVLNSSQDAFTPLTFVTGRLSLVNRSLTVTPKSGFMNAGTIVIGDGGSFTATTKFGQEGRTELAPSGVLQSPTVELRSGVLTGSGRVVGTVVNQAAVSPAGVLTIEGPLASYGVIDAVVGDGGRLAVTGQTEIRGTLRARVRPGTAIAAGDRFTVLQGPVTPASENFTRLEIDDLQGGLRLQPNVTSTGVELVANAG